MIEPIELTQAVPASEPRPKPLYFKLAEDGRTPVQIGDYMEWWHWSAFEAKGTRVARTHLDGHIVSTVFSGLVAEPDHVFETKIFAIGQDCRVKYEKHLALWLCQTRDEAELQHQQAITWLQEQLEVAGTWNMLV